MPTPKSILDAALEDSSAPDRWRKHQFFYSHGSGDSERETGLGWHARSRLCRGYAGVCKPISHGLRRGLIAADPLGLSANGLIG